MPAVEFEDAAGGSAIGCKARQPANDLVSRVGSIEICHVAFDAKYLSEMRKIEIVVECLAHADSARFNAAVALGGLRVRRGKKSCYPDLGCLS